MSTGSALNTGNWAWVAYAGLFAPEITLLIIMAGYHFNPGMPFHL